MNSFAEPAKVAPVETKASGLCSRFVYDFPAGRVTFIRLQDARAVTAVRARVAPSSGAQHATAQVVVHLMSGGHISRRPGPWS